MHRSATQTLPRAAGKEHWTSKGSARLFLWQKPRTGGAAPRGTILFVHGSSMASQPTFDLHVPGRPDSSAMDWFRAQGYAGGAPAAAGGAGRRDAVLGSPALTTTDRNERPWLPI